MKKKRFLIYFCIGLSLVTLLGVSFFFLRKLKALEKNIGQVGYSYQVIIQISLLEKNLQNAEISQRGYLLTGTPSFLESYLAELRDIPEILVTLDALTSGNSYQQRNLDTLGQAINNQLQLLKENMNSDPDNGLPEQNFEESNRQMNVISSVIANIKEYEGRMLSERSDTASRNTSESRRSSFLSLTFAFVLCCVAAVCIIWFFNRNENYRSELEDQLSKLTILNSEIKGLTMASTHNLQEPMRKVQTIIDRLQHRSGFTGQEDDSGLHRIKQIYAKQQATNNMIIDYYHILSRPKNVTLVDLQQVLRTLHSEKQPLWNFTMAVDALKKVHADQHQMTLLFTHIINNSVQFSHPERLLNITIKEAPLPVEDLPPGIRNRSYYCVCISDNGIGIDDAYREKIFRLFQKIDDSSSAGQQQGMGLSFSRRIMLNHGGWASARKNPQSGTSIFLFFPNSTTV